MNTVFEDNEQLVEWNDDHSIVHIWSKPRPALWEDSEPIDGHHTVAVVHNGASYMGFGRTFEEALHNAQANKNDSLEES